MSPKFKKGDLVEYCYGDYYSRFKSYNGSLFKILEDFTVDPFTARVRYGAQIIKNLGPWTDNHIGYFDEECFRLAKKRENPTYRELMAKLK